MARPRRQWCRLCDRHVRDCGPLSARGKCQACATARMVANIEQMHAMSGPAVKPWRQKVAASVGAVLLDEIGLP